MTTVTTFFWILFALTLTALAGTAVSGWRRCRRVHLLLAPTAIGLLVVTIVLAEQMAVGRSFPREQMRIHLIFAKTAALLMLPVVATGLTVLRRPRWRRVHLTFVVLFGVAAVIATGTGIWVFSLSSPR